MSELIGVYGNTVCYVDGAGFKLADLPLFDNVRAYAYSGSYPEVDSRAMSDYLAPALAIYKGKSIRSRMVRHRLPCRCQTSSMQSVRFQAYSRPEITTRATWLTRCAAIALAASVRCVRQSSRCRVRIRSMLCKAATSSRSSGAARLR